VHKRLIIHNLELEMFTVCVYDYHSLTVLLALIAMDKEFAEQWEIGGK
jgi:hypothetical protein